MRHALSLWAAGIGLAITSVLWSQSCSQANFTLGAESKSALRIRQDYGGYIFRLYVGDRQGTGFLIDPSAGYLLTAHHVIMNENGKPADNVPIIGDLADWPGETFQFTFVKSLCTDFSNERCETDTGEYAGIDAALLKLSDVDLKRYRKMVSTALPLDLMLGGQLPETAYFMGYPGKQNQRASPAYLDNLDTTVNSDFGTSGVQSPLLQWRLSKPVVRGESGSPVFDASGRVFAVLLQEDPDLNSRGLALNLGELLEVLQIVFQELALSDNASRLKQKITTNAYERESDVVHDLKPLAISNKELAAVILSIASNGPPRFRFTSCLVAAVVSRNLGAILHYLIPSTNALASNINAIYQLQNAAGFYAAGQIDRAAEAYAAAYKSTTASDSSIRDSRISMKAALGAAKSFNKLNDPALAKGYSTIALNVAYRSSDKEYASLASTYLFDIAQAKHDPGAARHAKVAFVQAPNPVLIHLNLADRATLVRKYSDLPAEDWTDYMRDIKMDLEPKLIGIRPLR